jgi:uncharacterized membrane protein YphA (DoxX/SURF4 family)
MRRPILNAALWTAQILLAALFVFAGGMKLVMPVAEMTRDSQIPGALLRGVGVAELLGGLGMLLPAVFRVRTALVPRAAAGLVLVMCGAVGATLATGQTAGALVSVAVGTILAAVAYGRGVVLPHAEREAVARGAPALG